jgi:hypothetical protein
MLDAVATRLEFLMVEACFCGRVGELTEREVAPLRDGGQGLVCPECGHLDRLLWLPQTLAANVLAEAAAHQAQRRPLNPFAHAA